MDRTDYYKIGYTGGEVFERLAALQTGNPQRLIVRSILETGTLADEQRIQTSLAHCRTDGGDEWFELTDDQVQQLTKGWSEPNEQPQWAGYYREASQAGGLHAADVRPVRRGQQDTTPARIKDVFHAGFKDGVSTGDQPIVIPLRKEYNQRIETDRE